MNSETFPTVTIPLPGLSNDSLAQVIEILNREGTTIAQFPGADMDDLARHYDGQLHVALLERYSRNLATERQRKAEVNLRLLGASVSHNNAMEIPA